MINIKKVLILLVLILISGTAFYFAKTYLAAKSPDHKPGYLTPALPNINQPVETTEPAAQQSNFLELLSVEPDTLFWIDDVPAESNKPVALAPGIYQVTYQFGSKKKDFPVKVSERAGVQVTINPAIGSQLVTPFQSQWKREPDQDIVFLHEIEPGTVHGRLVFYVPNPEPTLERWGVYEPKSNDFYFLNLPNIRGVSPNLKKLIYWDEPTEYKITDNNGSILYSFPTAIDESFSPLTNVGPFSEQETGILFYEQQDTFVRYSVMNITNGEIQTKMVPKNKEVQISPVSLSSDLKSLIVFENHVTINRIVQYSLDSDWQTVIYEGKDLFPIKLMEGYLYLQKTGRFGAVYRLNLQTKSEDLIMEIPFLKSAILVDEKRIVYVDDTGTVYFNSAKIGALTHPNEPFKGAFLDEKRVILYDSSTYVLQLEN